MTATTIERGPAPEDERAEWLAARKHGIGGSDAAAIVGLSTYRSPIEVYLDKISPDSDEDGASESMRWGQRLEDAVASHFAELNHVGVTRVAPMVWHPDHAFMFSNVDRLTTSPDGTETRVLECKTHSAFQAEQWDAGPPDHVVIQVMHYLECLELARAHVAVLIGGQEYRQFELERDDELIASLIVLEAEFWERVQNREPPPAGETASAGRALSAMYRDAATDSEVELGADGGHLVDMLRSAKAAEKEAKAEAQRLSNMVKEALGAHRVGTIDGQKVVSWSRWEQDAIDLAALKEKYPDVAAELTRVDYRDRLTPTKPKAVK